MTTASTLTPLAMNHYATQTFDAAATHRFWTEAMGCRLVGALRFPARAISSGEEVSAFIHTFYALAEVGCVAFFELEESPEKQSDNLPAWTRHLALSVRSRDELAQWQRHFAEHNVPVDGEIDHDGLFYSLYVTDPNGVRVELTYQTRDLGSGDAAEAQRELDGWITDRAARQA